MNRTLVNIGKLVGSVVLAFVLVLLIWWLFLQAYPNIGIIGRTPWETISWLTASDTQTKALRKPVIDAYKTTLIDSAIGFGFGLGAAVVCSGLFVSIRPVAQTFMPVALLLRTVPLIALTPLIVTVVGREWPVVAVIGTIVVFFPALVMLMSGLSNVPGNLTDVIHAYGGSKWTLLSKVSFPNAIPSFFAAAKLSVPGAVVGATLAEWLGTGKGLGSLISKAVPNFQYPQLWASVLLITLTSIVLYAIVGIIEELVDAAMGQRA